MPDFKIVQAELGTGQDGANSYELAAFDGNNGNERKHKALQQAAVNVKRDFKEKFIMHNMAFKDHRLYRRHQDEIKIQQMEKIKGKVKSKVREEYQDIVNHANPGSVEEGPVDRAFTSSDGDSKSERSQEGDAPPEMLEDSKHFVTF